MVSKNYFTASLSAFAARNFGTRIAGISIDSPVRGLRPVRAFRVFDEKIPRPAIETSFPFFKESTIQSIAVSTARSASARVPPTVSCTLSIMSALFIVYEIGTKWRLITLCNARAAKMWLQTII